MKPLAESEDLYLLYSKKSILEKINKGDLLDYDVTNTFMLVYNEYSKGEQFTKSELMKKNPDAIDMMLFNIFFKGKELFTQTEINNA